MGEVMAFVSIIVGLAIAWPCLVIWFALAFPEPVKRSRERLEEAPWRSFGVGLLLLIPVLIGIRVVTDAPGGAKLAGWVVLAPLFLTSTLGGAGLVQLIGDRVQKASAPISPLAALVRGALMTWGAGLFPVVGWFFFGPVTTIVSLGAGTLGLFARKQREHYPAPVYYHPPAAPYAADPAYAPPAASQFAPPPDPQQRLVEAPPAYAPEAAPAPEAATTARP
jgi:hypothetical protein